MEASIVQRIIIFLVFEQNVSSLTMHTENVTILQEDKRIILNCTYHKDPKEAISDRNIRWQKQIENGFKDLAYFSSPGGPEPFIHQDMQPVYNNRTELIAPNSSLSAVMIIKDPICSDVGTYQCKIEYFLDTLVETKTSNSIVGFSAKKPEEFSVFPREREENQSIRLTCSADVGNPTGIIQIWKIRQNSNTPELVFKSKSTMRKPDNCIHSINVTTTYTTTKEDHGAIFRCSSKNNLTLGPAPSRESSKISVIYGPDMPEITLTPSKSVYSGGDSLTIECNTDSNPPPVFTWSFLSENNSEQIELPHDKSNLTFKHLQPTHSGTYICTVTNAAKSKYPNTKSDSVFVGISQRMYPSCDHCGQTKICQHKNGKNECIFNIWIPIAVFLIIASAIFAVTSFILIILRRITQESTETKYMFNIQSRSHPHNESSEEENGGGYSSPTDLNRMQKAPLEDTNVAYSASRDEIRIQENSSLLPHNNEPDGYATTEEVVQYAAIQKKSTKDNQVSNDNV